MNYCVITADVRKSREAPDRRQLQELIFDTLNKANQDFSDQLLANFEITIGDEWQGVLNHVSNSYRIGSFFIEQLYPYSLAIGIGEGTIDTNIRSRSVEMDGAAFHRSRHAIDLAKEMDSEIVYQTSAPKIDILLNNNCKLLQLFRQSWTEKQFQKVKLYKYLQTETAVANTLNVSQVEINKSLASTNGRNYLQAEENLNLFLEQYYNQN